MELDANEYYLNKYLSGEERLEKAYEAFLLSIDDDLACIEDIISFLLKSSSRFEFGNQEYDFSDDVRCLLKDLL